MASAIKGATLTTRKFGIGCFSGLGIAAARLAGGSKSVFSSTPSHFGNGIVSVTTTSVSADSRRFVAAGPQNTPWVAHAYTALAPNSLAILAAPTTLLPVE